MAARPRIDVLLDGFGLNTSAGFAAWCAVVLVEGPDQAGRATRILIDPADVTRRRVLWAALADRGLTPRDIDIVVLTHAHWDHMHNIDVFDHAPVYLHPDERRYAAHPDRADWATPAWTGLVLERADLRDAEEGCVIIPGVRVVELPGHSVGSVGVAVEGDNGVSLVTGDAVPYASAARSGVNPLVFSDVERSRASIERAMASADTIYPGHDQAFHPTRDAGTEYVRPYRLTIRGMSYPKEGLTFDPEPEPPWVMPGL